MVTPMWQLRQQGYADDDGRGDDSEGDNYVRKIGIDDNRDMVLTRMSKNKGDKDSDNGIVNEDMNSHRDGDMEDSKYHGIDGAMEAVREVANN